MNATRRCAGDGASAARGSMLHQAQRPLSIDVLAEIVEVETDDCAALLDQLQVHLTAVGLSLARTEERQSASPTCCHKACEAEPTDDRR